MGRRTSKRVRNKRKARQRRRKSVDILLESRRLESFWSRWNANQQQPQPQYFVIPLRLDANVWIRDKKCKECKQRLYDAVFDDPETEVTARRLAPKSICANCAEKYIIEEQEDE